MNQTREDPLFHGGSHQLTVIHTDLAETESLIKQLAEKERRENPGSFAGLTPCVYYKMPYVQPYEEFRELRRLILRIRENTGLRAGFRGIVAIEATEWLGHEREEYFTVVLKYLYDHRDTWRAAMILNDCNSARLHRFTAACARFLTPKVVGIRLFEEENALSSRIAAAFQKQNAVISGAAASMLAGELMQPALKEERSLELIERTVGEVISCSGGARKLTAAHVREYLKAESSLLTMLAGNIPKGERGMEHDEKNLYL